MRPILPAMTLGAAIALALPSALAAPEDRVTKSTDSFDFSYRSRYWSSIRNTVAVAEPTREKLIRDFGVGDEPDRVEVRFARNVEEMRRLSPRQPPPYADAVAFWRENLIVISLTSSHHRPVSLDTVFRHELVHLALRWAIGDARVPRWFNEGLAVVYSDELALERVKAFWPAAVSGRALPLGRLDRSFPRREFEVNAAYAQSADFVRFLVTHAGRWRLRELLARLERGEPFDDAMGATWNSTPREIEQRWRAGLTRRYTILPGLTAGLSLWSLVAVLAVVAYVRRRREIRQRIDAMPDEAFAPTSTER